MFFRSRNPPETCDFPRGSKTSLSESESRDLVNARAPNENRLPAVATRPRANRMASLAVTGVKGSLAFKKSGKSSIGRPREYAATNALSFWVRRSLRSALDGGRNRELGYSDQSIN
jgi:hypothetical protein